MSRSRGRVSRAASALLFCAAALAAAVFPEGSAGGRGVGFAPGQVPFDLLLIPGENSPGVAPDDPRFDGGELCGELGGTLQESGQEEVCGGIDRNDTFCIAGAAEAFPCRGLYKHVIACNAGYNRPALNPFFCGAKCASGQQARGANCERVVLPAEAGIFPPSPATLHVAEGHRGAVAVGKAKAGVTLDFSPAAGSSFILLPPSAEEGDYAVLFPQGFGAGLDVSLTARIVCAGCYPSRLTVIASLLPALAPEQPGIAAVFGEPFSAVPAAPEDYAGATLTLAAGAAAGFSLESGTLTTSAGGGPDAGIYQVTVGATHSGFVGTLALVISAEISRRPLPEAGWGLRAGDERAWATIAAGHPGAFHRAASRNGLASLVLPAPIAGLRTALEGATAAFYADLPAGVLNTTAVLTVRHWSDASSGKRNYADLAQTVAVWMSVVAAPGQGRFRTTAIAEIAGISLASPDFAVGAFLDLDPADAFEIGADGVVRGARPPEAVYELTAGWTAEGMLGTLALGFEVIVGEGEVINPDDVVAVRTASLAAAAGFSGAGWTVTASGGHTLDFRGEDNNYNGHTLRALGGGEWELGLTTGLESEGRTVAARGRALCGDCLAGQFVTVTAVFAAVLAPGQATLAGVYGEDGAAYELTPPADYATGGTFAVVGVSGPGGNFVVDGTGAGLTRDSSNTPNAGPHVVSVAMTHPGFLGSLTLEVTANIARKIPSDVAGLSPLGRTTVTAAFGHAGEVFQLTLANADYEFGRYDFSTINAGSVAARVKETDGIDDADRELTAAELLAKMKYLHGLTLAASADRLTLSAALTAALAAGEALPPDDGTSFMLVYAQRRDGSPNFTDYGQFVFYRIETLDAPPVAGLRRAGPLTAGTALFDFAAGSYANGDYAGAEFSELGGAEGAGALDATAGGAVTVAGELTEPGYYAITVLAASPDGAGFVGTARLTLSLTLSRVIDLDAAVWPRVITTGATPGFYGARASFLVSTGYVVENPDYDFSSGEVRYDELSRTFSIPGAFPSGVSGVTAAVTAEVRCAREEDLCDVRGLTVTAIFYPVTDPGQATLTAFYGESFGHAGRLPAGYETGGRFALLGVSGVDAASLSAISLRADSSGALTLDAAGGLLSAGIATATIGMTHPDFFGTVTLRARLEILPAHPGLPYALPEAERNPGVVTVAANWRGVAHRAELGDGAAGGEIRLPAESPRNVSLALSGDGRRVLFALSSPLAGGAEFAETVALTVTRNDLNYYDLGQAVELRVSALAVPAAVNQDGAGSPAQPFRSGNLHDYGRGIYAGAVFGKKSGADELQVSERGVVSVISAGITEAGSYGIVITATSGAFLGAAEFEFALDVGVLGGLPGSYGVPPTERTERRRVAAGYTGSVAFFAASTVGVTLRTPASAPAGFDFETVADFVSPAGFAVSLTAGLLAGEAIGGAFEVGGEHADYADVTIPLVVTIEALAPPSPDTGAPPAPVSGEIFDFSHPSYAGGDYRNADFGAVGGASADLTVYADGRVETTRELDAGIYEITVLAHSSPDYLGTATLSLGLTVRWLLEYGVDSGGGGEVRALDGAGEALDSGALLAADAPVTLRAVPSGTYYVSGWTGACGGNVGGVGSADNPGIAQTCALTAGDHLRVSVIFSPIPIADADGIALENRAVNVSVAAGYAGSVAFFAASAAGVTLRTPDSAPAGFGFATGAEFVLPNGFAVSLTTAARPGGEVSGNFEVVASRAGHAETTITLGVTVRALTAPAPAIGIKAGRFSGDVFNFKDAGYAGGAYRNAKFREGGVLSRAFDVDEDGQVVTARDLEAGAFRIFVLAESPDYLGTATLVLWMTVRWRVEYGVDSGAGELVGKVGTGSHFYSGALRGGGYLLDFFATPSETHYVSGWTGDCAGVGSVGHSGAPGYLHVCTLPPVLTVEDSVRVGVVFSPGRMPGGGVRERVRRARTVAGYTGPVAFFAGSPAGVTVRTPSSAPAGFDFETGAEFVSPAGFAVSLLSSPGAGKAATARFDAVVNFRDYLEGTIGLRVEVSVLEPSPPQSARTLIAHGERFSAVGLHHFGVGDYAGAVFGKQSGADELTVSEFGIVSAEEAAAGLYTIVMTATSAAFLGTAAFRFDLDVTAPPPPLPEMDGVPPDLRAQTRSFAPGHTGSVGFFAAAGAGVTLRTPDVAPDGFGFETGADFVWPNGFAVSLTTNLRAGETRAGIFSVVASRAGHVTTVIPLRVTARGLTTPRPEIEVKHRPFSGEVFDFKSGGYAGGAYQNATFREGGDLSAELDVDANGRVTTTGDLEPGVYRIMALAESDADYTGTATLALLLTVGWRLEYVSAAAGGTVSAKIRGSQLTVLSGAAIGPGRLIEFTAEPSESHFVEDWTGACAGLGRDGRNDNPGQSQTCVLKVESNAGVTAVFAEADSSALVLFNGTGVQTVGQTVEVVHRGLNFGYVLSLKMVYHGIQRNFHVMRLSTWASNNRYLLKPPGDGRLVGPTNASGLADYGFAVKTCNRNGWRVPTVGEIIGLSHSGDARWSAAFAGGRGNLRANTAAGALRGLEIPVLTVSAGADGNPVPAGFYELDSRDANGYYAAVRYDKAPGEAAGEVHFPWSVETGRWIMCVRDAGGAAESPELAAVLLESGGRRVGDPVDRGTGPILNDEGNIFRSRATPPPSFTVTATLHPAAKPGDALFTGTVYSWKHKDAPEILRRARPLVTAQAAAGYDADIADAAGDSGTEIQILVGAPRPAAVAGQTTLLLRASHALGISATIAVVVDVLGTVVYAPLEVAAGRGTLSAALPDGTAVDSGDALAYEGTLHVTATPEPGYYVHSWSGACVGAAIGSAEATGEAQTCVARNVGLSTAVLRVGVLFGRDECRESSPCDTKAFCTDMHPLAADSAEPVQCVCAEGHTSSDNGRTCVET